MDQRRILVIGSQCKALGGLRFLPQLAQDLYAVMTDPERGACVAAIEGNGLVLDPSVKAGLRGNRPYSPRRCHVGGALAVNKQ